MRNVTSNGPIKDRIHIVRIRKCLSHDVTYIFKFKKLIFLKKNGIM